MNREQTDKIGQGSVAVSRSMYRRIFAFQVARPSWICLIALVFLGAGGLSFMPWGEPRAVSLHDASKLIGRDALNGSTLQSCESFNWAAGGCGALSFPGSACYTCQVNSGGQQIRASGTGWRVTNQIVCGTQMQGVCDTYMNCTSLAPLTGNCNNLTLVSAQ